MFRRCTKRKRKRPIESRDSTPPTNSTPFTSTTPPPDYIPLESSPRRNLVPAQPQIIYSPLKPLTFGPRTPLKPYGQSPPPIPEQAKDYLDLSLSSSSPESPPIHELQDFSYSEHVNYSSTSDSPTNSTPPPRGTWRNIRQHSAPAKIDYSTPPRLHFSQLEHNTPARKRLKIDTEEAVDKAIKESSLLSEEDIDDWDNFNTL